MAEWPSFTTDTASAAPLDRGFGKLRGVGIAGGFVCNRAKAKSLCSVVGCSLQPSVVERETLGLPVFQVQLAVVRAVQGVVDDPLDLGPVHSGLGEKEFFVAAHVQNLRQRTVSIRYIGTCAGAVTHGKTRGAKAEPSVAWHHVAMTCL
jgi:hypothetical protein